MYENSYHYCSRSETGKNLKRIFKAKSSNSVMTIPVLYYVKRYFAPNSLFLLNNTICVTVMLLVQGQYYLKILYLTSCYVFVTYELFRIKILSKYSNIHDTCDAELFTFVSTDVLFCLSKTNNPKNNSLPYTHSHT